jgi:hypothetical protein
MVGSESQPFPTTSATASARQARPSILIPVKGPSFLVSPKKRSNIGDGLQTSRTWLLTSCVRLVTLGGGADFSGL